MWAGRFDALIRLMAELEQLLGRARRQSVTELVTGQTRYRAGDDVRLSLPGPAGEQPFLARIAQILRLTDAGRRCCVLRVWLYLTKAHLNPRLYRPFLPHISENEHFLSEAECFVPAACLRGRVEVVALEEYLRRHPEPLPFCQSAYCPATQRTVPDIAERERVCYCKAIECPDLLYLVCERCQQPVHLACAGLASPAAAPLNFTCRDCQSF